MIVALVTVIGPADNPFVLLLILMSEVIVAPFAGFLFSISATAMMAEQWPDLSKFEEYAAFATIVLIGMGQTWLVFRGLLIGRLPLAWSKSGLMALQRGHINGEQDLHQVPKNDERHVLRREDESMRPLLR